MYDALGYGWGNSVLAFAGIAIGLPAPCILWWYGQKLRVSTLNLTFDASVNFSLGKISIRSWLSISYQALSFCIIMGRRSQQF